MKELLCDPDTKDKLGLVVLGIYAILEAWLGKTGKVKSGSVLEIFFNLAKAAYNPIFTRTVELKESQMEKAYELKALVEKLKAHGLDVAEEGAKAVVESVMDWAAESAAKSENKIDDLVAPLLLQSKAHILSQVDKIDGKEG